MADYASDPREIAVATLLQANDAAGIRRVGAQEGSAAAGNVWVALEAGADPDASSRALRRAHERFFIGPADTDVRDGVRTIVAASWRRALRAGIGPGDGAGDPGVLDDREVARRRDASGLAGVLPILRELVDVQTRESRNLLIVTGADGRLLWVEGPRELRVSAERVELVPGALWDERSAGTNAMGTALAVDHPVQIFAAEHVRTTVHDWTCAAAPLRHPATGALLGSIDLTAPARAVHPHSLALVSAAARAAGALLPELLAAAGPTVRLRALGRDRATLDVGDRHVVLSRRHSEIAVLLALHPEGLSAEQLALELFGERGKPVSVRAELSRLRRLLGTALDTQPYCFSGRVEADVLDVQEHLDGRRPALALEAYRGQLLPCSEAPGILDVRRGLDAGVRAAVVASGDDALLKSWAESPLGRDDLPALELLLRRRPMDPELARLGRRAARLRAG